MAPPLLLLLAGPLQAAPVLPSEEVVAAEGLARFDRDRDGQVRPSEIDAVARNPGTGLAMDLSGDGVIQGSDWERWLRRTLARLPRPALPEDPSALLFPGSLLVTPAYAKPRKEDSDKLLLHVPDFKQALTEAELQLIVDGATTTANDAGTPPDLRAGDHIYSGWVAKPASGKLSLEVKAGTASWKGELDATGADAATPLPVDRKEDGTLAGLPIPAHDAPAGQPPAGVGPMNGEAAGAAPPPGVGGPPPGSAGAAGVANVNPDTPMANVPVTGSSGGPSPLVVVLAALAAGVGVGVGVAVAPSLRRKR